MALSYSLPNEHLANSIKTPLCLACETVDVNNHCTLKYVRGFNLAKFVKRLVLKQQGHWRGSVVNVQAICLIHAQVGCDLRLWFPLEGFVALASCNCKNQAVCGVLEICKESRCSRDFLALVNQATTVVKWLDAHIKSLLAKSLLTGSLLQSVGTNSS